MRSASGGIAAFHLMAFRVGGIPFPPSGQKGLSRAGTTPKMGAILTGMIPNLRVEVLDPVLCRGLPREKNFQALDRLADAIAAKHREKGFR